MTKVYADILAQAMQLLGKKVVVHWIDENGELCGVVGTLKRIAEPHKNFEGSLIPKQLNIENWYASVDIGRVIHIEQETQGC